MPKTIKDVEFTGFCPQCLLEQKERDMRANNQDFWECETCSLQITTFPPFAVILRWRGEKKFRLHVDVAKQHHSSLFLVRPNTEKGKEIYPDESEIIADSFDLQEYLASVYDTYQEFLKSMFNEKAPELKSQEIYLEQIADEEWENLVELYKQVKQNGLQSEEFRQFHQMLYDLKIIFSFDWKSWTEGQMVIDKENKDFTASSLLNVSMYLTLIFRRDRFDDISIKTAYSNGTLDQIFQRLEQLT